MTSQKGVCERCGKPIPQRADPRGRQARFCSGAYRAAASRERRKRQYQEELAQAHEQATLKLRTPREGIADAAHVVREMTRDLRAGREFYVSDEHQELVIAVREFAELMEKNARRSAAPAGLSRAARRAKKSGDIKRLPNSLPGFSYLDEAYTYFL